MDSDARVSRLARPMHSLLTHLGLRADEATLSLLVGAVLLSSLLDSCQG